MSFESDMRDHPKWLALSPLAYKLGVRLVLYAREHSPDRGFVPDCVVLAYASTKIMARKLSAELVACGQKAGKAHGILVQQEGGYTIHGFLERRSVVRPEGEAEAAPEQDDDLPPAPPRTTKAEAGRIGGLRSAEARAAASGSAQPRRLEAPRDVLEAPRRSSPKHSSEAQLEARLEAATEARAALSYPDNSGISGSDQKKRNPPPLIQDLKDGSAGARDHDDERTSGVHRVAPRPTSLEQALKLPVMERAAIALRNEGREAMWLVPQAWPEVLAVFAMFEKAWSIVLGKPGDWSRDPGTRAVVALLASFSLEQIAIVAERSLKNPVVRNGQRALGVISPEVARRTLAGEFGGGLPVRRGPVQEDHGASGWESQEARERAL